MRTRTRRTTHEDTTARADRPTPWRWAAVPVVVLVVVLGTLVAGGLLTDDFAVARVLTGAFLAVAAVAALAVGWRWRALAVPVVGTFALVAGSVTGWLVLTSSRDTTVLEDVVLAPDVGPHPVLPGSPRRDDLPASSAGPVLLAQGTFAGAAHETTGTAALIALEDGRRVLTLTDLATDPGPDLRVYLVPAGATGVTGALDLGALKGNLGTQQYDVPDQPVIDPGSVVIWCRAFSVSFGAARLSAV